jgi:hypothetical protein
MFLLEWQPRGGYKSFSISKIKHMDTQNSQEYALLPNGE